MSKDINRLFIGMGEIDSVDLSVSKDIEVEVSITNKGAIKNSVVLYITIIISTTTVDYKKGNENVLVDKIFDDTVFIPCNVVSKLSDIIMIKPFKLKNGIAYEGDIKLEVWVV